MGVDFAKAVGAEEQDFDLIDTVTPTPLPPPPSRTHISMSPSFRPQYIFSIHSNNTVFAFDILKEMRFDHRDREFRLSVVVERIWCHGSDNHLVLEGQVCKKTCNIAKNSI
jgi:hypothetical protein